jgi:3-hydroxyisobutyrate dehydrogenase-like beta-hydroxyacid dehydrogenase
MSDVTIGLLHPGEMGAAVGQCLAAAGHEVLWADQGRSPATRERAEAAGLKAAGIGDIVARSGVVFSVCPPHAALDVAREVAGAGFGGLYVDANAVSPARAREVAGVVRAGGAEFVDGGIIGTPPAAPGFIRCYLSGARAEEVRDLFGGTDVDARVITGAGEVAASAMKMAYVSWTKGSAALVLAARALARADGVEDALLAEWAISQPGREQQTERAAGSAAAKGWRWVAEMEEIVELIEVDDRVTGPLGVKAVGEIGQVGSAAAIANAVYHATGYRAGELPIAVEHLLAHLPSGPAAAAAGAQPDWT